MDFVNDNLVTRISDIVFVNDDMVTSISLFLIMTILLRVYHGIFY